MNQWKLLTALAFVLAGIAAQAQKVTLNGYVTDKKTGERLLGASIFISEKNLGTTSNAYGFYSITVPADSAEISFSYTGYSTQTKKISLIQDQSLNIELEQSRKI
jgi:hypothetical protein